MIGAYRYLREGKREGGREGGPYQELFIGKERLDGVEESDLW